MKSLKIWTGAAIAVALGVSASPAAAALVTYGDLAAWNTAVPGATTLIIPDSVTGVTLIGSGDASVTYSGVTFSQSTALGNGDLYNISSTYDGCCQADVSSQVASVGSENILITLPGFTTGFSLSFGTFDGSDVSFLLSNGDTLTLGSVASNSYLVPGFFGVTDATPFNSILVRSPDLVLDVSNIAYGAVNGGVPEPGVWGLMVVGFGGLGATLRARRRLATA
jgi:hypothetical protein